MAIIKEFKEFAMKGSMLDLAVGLVLGVAFGAVIKSLVDEIIMPIAGFFLGGRDFANLYYVLGSSSGLAGNEALAEARESGAAVIGYGQFINVIITFLIVAWVVFLIVKAVNKAKARRAAEPAPTPTTRPCPECMTDIPRAATRCSACAVSVEAMPND